MIFPFLQISRTFHKIQWFFHDLETDLNFNDFSRAVGTLVYISESLQKHWKSIANRWVQDREASNGHTKDTTRLFHGPWHDAVGEHICAQPFRMWNRLRFHMFMQVSQIFQRRKSNTNKQDFEN